MGRVVINPPVIHELRNPYPISVLYVFTFRLDGALTSRETEWLSLTVTTWLLCFAYRVATAKLHKIAVYDLKLNIF